MATRPSGRPRLATRWSRTPRARPAPVTAMTVRPSPHRPAASPALLLSGLIALHTVDGRMVFVNPEQITQVREPLPESSKGRQLTTGVQCVITLTDRTYAAVREDCAKVHHAAETAERGGLAVEKPGKGARARNAPSLDHIPPASGDRGGAGAGGEGNAGGGAAGGAGGGAGGGGSGAGGGGGTGGGGGGSGGQGGGGGSGNPGGGNGNGGGNGQGGNHGDNGHHGQGNSGNGNGGK